MFDEKTILTRLQNGENAQDIANEMAAMINAANKAYAEEMAEAAKKKSEVQKREELQEIIDAFHHWAIKYYDAEIVEDLFSELNAEMVLELIESLRQYVKAMEDLSVMLNGRDLISKSNFKKVPAKEKKIQNADDTIKAFLKNMGW